MNIILIALGLFFAGVMLICLILTLMFWLVDIIVDFLERRKKWGVKIVVRKM